MNIKINRSQKMLEGKNGNPTLRRKCEVYNESKTSSL